jgi:hypothetical protein
MSQPAMPADVREAIIECLAQALMADVEKHRELYGLECAADQTLAPARGELPRGSTRSRRAAGAPPRRRRRQVSVEAVPKGGYAQA